MLLLFLFYCVCLSNFPFWCSRTGAFCVLIETFLVFFCFVSLHSTTYRSTAVLRFHSTWTMTHRHCRAKKPINVSSAPLQVDAAVPMGMVNVIMSVSSSVKFQILPHPYRSHPEIRKSRHPFLLKMIAKRNLRRPRPRQQHNRHRRRRPVQQQHRRQRLWLVIVIVMYKVMPRSRHHLQHPQRRFLLQCYHQSNRLKP